MENYLKNLYSRFENNEYESFNYSESDRGFHRKEISLSKFGKVDTYIFIRNFAEPIKFDEIKLYSTKVFEYAKKLRTGLPLGFGGSLVVYPLIIGNMKSENDIRLFEKYVPKHWAAVEFPVIASLSLTTLHYYSGTPMWGAAYYKGLRNEVEELFHF